MIATSKTIKRDPNAPAVADPRRSYDRGIWIGTLANDANDADKPDNSMEQAISLATVSLEDLRRELDRRQKGLDALTAKRARLAQELSELDAQIRALQANDTPAARSRSGSAAQAAQLAVPRVKNSIALPDAVALEAEVGQVVTPPEIAKRVLASGYQTRSKTFTAVVTNVLSNDTRFKRVGRGRYERV